MAKETNFFMPNHRVKKSDLIKEINQLNLKIQSIERERSTHVFSKHGEFYSDFAHLQELDIKSARERQTEKVKVQQQLSGIRYKVKKFHRELKDVKPTPEFVEKLKEIMEDVESHINNFKEQQRQQYEDLVKDEKITSQEITALEKRFEMWTVQGASSARSTARSKPVSVVANMDVTKDLPPVVAAFERFVEQSGGVKAGWDEYDHSTFMKYRIKHKGKPTFIRELIPCLPTRSETEIIAHERWYQQYLELNDEKKEAIQKWREKKLEEKEQVLVAAQTMDDSDDEQQRRRDEQYREMVEREKLERRGELNKWKVEKELAKAEDEEMKLRAELEKSKREEQRKRQKAEQKRRVEEYKARRAEEEARREAEEAERERQEAELRRQQTQDLARFQQRDMAVVRSKVSRERAKQEEELEKRRRLARMKDKVEANVTRDRSRLLQPTAGWIERQEQSSQQAAGASGGPMLHMPHRAVPTWRQGLR